MHTLNTHTDIQTLGQSAAGTPLPTPLMYITTHIKMHTHTHTKCRCSHCPTSCPLRSCYKV